MKKMKNLLAFMALAMGLASCEFLPDNPVEQGQTNESKVKIGGKEVDVKSFDHISSLLSSESVSSQMAASTEASPFVVEINSNVTLSTENGDATIELPFVDGSYTELKFDNAVVTSAEQPLVIKAAAGKEGEKSYLTISMPKTESGYLEVNMPSSTVILQSKDGEVVHFNKIVCTTATSTFIIGEKVEIELLEVAAGRYEVVAGGKVVDVIFDYDPIVIKDAEAGFTLDIDSTATFEFEVDSLYAASEEELDSLEFEVASDDEKVATVKMNDKGTAFTVTGVGKGEATVTINVKGDEYAKATLPVTVGGIPVEEVKLDKTELTMTIGDEAVQLNVTITPADATDADVAWDSSDLSVATVDGAGKVTAVAEGTATITAKAGDKTATCTVTVKPATVFVESIKLDKTELTATSRDAAVTLTATLNPTDATEKTVTWTSSNTDVATVADGKVTFVAPGTATITATATNNTDDTADDKTATCTVTVTFSTYTLAESTVGMLVDTDGNAYAATEKDYLPSSVTGAGMVVYKNGSNGLVIALTDENRMDWDTANSESGAAAHTPVIEGYTWKLPSQAEWKNLFTAIADYEALCTALSNVGGTELKLDRYWLTDQKVFNGQEYVVGIRFSADKPQGQTTLTGKSDGDNVRAFIAF